jgi:hypothetical protein
VIVGIRCFVLAKDEEVNIARCLAALRECNVPTVVLDSHSGDATADVARRMGAEAEAYDYTTHVDALEYICVERTRPEDVVMVLDADMRVSDALVREGQELLLSRDVDAVSAPVAMYWEGRPLPHGSMYPPKPFMFRGGKHYFEAIGHGEQLRDWVKVAVTKNKLVHNDLKSFEAYLDTQCRYCTNWLNRSAAGQAALRDRLRKTPLMMLAAPLYSFVMKLGFLSGKAGVGYAMDRMIAEAIKYRQFVAVQTGQDASPERRADRAAQASQGSH